MSTTVSLHEIASEFITDAKQGVAKTMRKLWERFETAPLADQVQTHTGLDPLGAVEIVARLSLVWDFLDRTQKQLDSLVMGESPRIEQLKAEAAAAMQQSVVSDVNSLNGSSQQISDIELTGNSAVKEFIEAVRTLKKLNSMMQMREALDFHKRKSASNSTTM